MDFLKKNRDLLLLGVSAFFSVLMFPLMAAPGASAFGGKFTCNVYELMGDANSVLAVLAMIFVIVALVAVIGIVVMEKVLATPDYNKFLAAGATLLLLVAGIFYFCGVAASDLNGADLGAGSVLCGIFTLLNAIDMGAYAFFAWTK